MTWMRRFLRVSALLSCAGRLTIPRSSLAWPEECWWYRQATPIRWPTSRRPSTSCGARDCAIRSSRRSLWRHPGGEDRHPGFSRFRGVAAQRTSRRCGNQIGTMDREATDRLALGILQASRRRVTKTNSCHSGCGRTMFDLAGDRSPRQGRHLDVSRLKIAVMGCIVNGPARWPNADYGYVVPESANVISTRARSLSRKIFRRQRRLTALSLSCGLTAGLTDGAC